MFESKGDSSVVAEGTVPPFRQRVARPDNPVLPSERQRLRPRGTVIRKIQVRGRQAQQPVRISRGNQHTLAQVQTPR
jgi:hypothetical protein